MTPEGPPRDTKDPPRTPWDPSGDPCDHKAPSLGPQGCQSPLLCPPGSPILRKIIKHLCVCFCCVFLFNDFALPPQPQKGPSRLPEAPQDPPWEPRGPPKDPPMTPEDPQGHPKDPPRTPQGTLKDSSRAPRVTSKQPPDPARRYARSD